MKEIKPYPEWEEENGNLMTAEEPSSEAAIAYEAPTVPDDIDYVHIADGVLQITPDIEEEIADVERGETVSMSEFKTMFAQWL